MTGDARCATCRVLRRYHDHPEAGRDHPFREPVVECTADEYEALARQLHDSIAEGQTVAETAKALRLLASSPVAPTPQFEVYDAPDGHRAIRATAPEDIEGLDDALRAGDALVGVLGAAPADCDRQDDLCVMHNAEWSTRNGADLGHCEWIEARMAVVPEWQAARRAIASSPVAPPTEENR